MIVTIQNNQTLFDIAMQYMGDASFAFTIALVNEIELTYDLVAGDVITIPDAEVLSSAQEKVVKYYLDNDIVPAGDLP